MKGLKTLEYKIHTIFIQHTHIMHNTRLRWRIHWGVEDTESSTNKQHVVDDSS
jgi:hypothetical protein